MKFFKAAVIGLIICLAAYWLPRLYIFFILLNGMSPNPIIKKPLSPAQTTLKEGLENMSVHPGRAKANFTKAIELNPKDANAYFLRGRIYAADRDYDKALHDFSKAIEIEPKHFTAYENRAKIYFYYGDYDEAWEDVHKAESLGYINPIFINKLKKASGREK